MMLLTSDWPLSIYFYVSEEDIVLFIKEKIIFPWVHFYTLLKQLTTTMFQSWKPDIICYSRNMKDISSGAQSSYSFGKPDNGSVAHS